jgi:hypothetical protein
MDIETLVSHNSPAGIEEALIDELEEASDPAVLYQRLKVDPVAREDLAEALVTSCECGSILSVRFIEDPAQITDAATAGQISGFDSMEIEHEYAPGYCERLDHTSQSFGYEIIRWRDLYLLAAGVPG